MLTLITMQARAQSSKPKGKLAVALDAQKKKSRNEILSESSAQTKQAREADAALEAQRWN
jgi:hypothetical protein